MTAAGLLLNVARRDHVVLSFETADRVLIRRQDGGCSPSSPAADRPGHVLPALAIAEALVDAGHDPAELHYVGAQRGIETRLLPATPYPHTFLDVVGLQRQLNRRNLRINASLAPKVAAATRRATALLRELQPRVAVSVGGLRQPAGRARRPPARRAHRRRQLRPATGTGHRARRPGGRLGGRLPGFATAARRRHRAPVRRPILAVDRDRSLRRPPTARPADRRVRGRRHGRLAGGAERRRRRLRLASRRRHRARRPPDRRRALPARRADRRRRCRPARPTRSSATTTASS